MDTYKNGSSKEIVIIVDVFCANAKLKLLFVGGFSAGTSKEDRCVLQSEGSNCIVA